MFAKSWKALTKLFTFVLIPQKPISECCTFLLCSWLTAIFVQTSMVIINMEYC